MNRSLLIVICDFLLLSMLSLARFDRQTPPDPTARVSAVAPMSEVAGGDIVDSLRESLKSEEGTRGELAQMLDTRAKELDQQRARTETLEQEKSRLEGEQERLERLRKQLEAERGRLSEQVQMSQQERDKLRDDVAAAQAREKLMQEQLASRERDLQQAQQNISTLQEQKGGAERDKAVLAAKLESAQEARQRLEGEIVSMRADKDAAHQQAEKLAANVGELAQAQQTAKEAFSQELKQATPLSPNVIFDNFRRNRAALRFATREAALLGQSDAAYERYTVFVRGSDGKTLALCETSGTPFRLAVLDRLRAVKAEMVLPGGNVQPVGGVSFMRADPRIVAFPADEAPAGAEPFALEDAPLRWATAVIVTAGGERYGEAPIRVLSGTSRYVEVQTSIANVLFGSFTPSEGDIVFSKNGNLIGFMVGPNRAICLSDLSKAAELELGDEFDAAKAADVAKTLADLAAGDTEPHGRL